MHTITKTVTIGIDDAECQFPVEINYEYAPGVMAKRDACGAPMEPDSLPYVTIISLIVRDERDGFPLRIPTRLTPSFEDQVAQMIEEEHEE